MATSQSLGQLGAKLKELGRGDLRRDLLKTIRTEAKPLGESAIESVGAYLPARYANELQNDLKAVVRSSLSPRGARVRVTARSASKPKRRTSDTDRGNLRHRVFGRDVWVDQSVRPGWWTDQMEAGSPRVRAAIVRTIDRISREL